MDFTSFVKELGIDKMSEAEQKPFFESVFRTLTMRVSLRLAQELTDEQTEQFEKLTAEDDETAFKQLEQKFPDFGKIYQEEIDGLKDDIKSFI